MSNSFVKDPQALLDYTWDWTDWLAEVADTISTASVTVSGVTAVGSPVVGAALVTQKVSGGVVGEGGLLVCQITTAAGLVDERSIYLAINNR